jgi:hypothetical protein
MPDRFVLKYRDTRPILEVALKNPDGTAHDLTGSTAWALHVRLPDGTTFTRSLAKQGADTAGVLRYIWQAADWVSGTSPPEPVLPAPAPSGRRLLRMEYEVTGGSSRMTFPNDGYDLLEIVGDMG